MWQDAHWPATAIWADNLVISLNRSASPVRADHFIDETILATTRAAFELHVGPDGAGFNRPMHVRLLRRMG